MHIGPRELENLTVLELEQACLYVDETRKRNKK